MKQFQYTIKDELGVHARPAGLLVKLAKQYTSTITIEKNGKTCDMRKLMAVMGMGIRQGETITVTAEGRGGSGSTTVYAVSDPDNIAIRDANSSLLTALNAGDEPAVLALPWTEEPERLLGAGEWALTGEGPVLMLPPRSGGIWRVGEAEPAQM